MFPYPGVDDGRDGDERRFGLSDLDLGRALTAIEDRGTDAARDGGRDAFRRGAASFLAGWDTAAKEYVGEYAAAALSGVDDHDRDCGD